MDAMQKPSDPAGELDPNPDLNLGIELQDDLKRRLELHFADVLCVHFGNDELSHLQVTS